MAEGKLYVVVFVFNFKRFLKIRFSTTCVSPNTKSSTRAMAGAGLGPGDPGSGGHRRARPQPHALSGPMATWGTTRRSSMKSGGFFANYR